MRLNAVKILKISITNSPKSQILEEIQKYLTQSGKNRQKALKIYTPNTEQLVFATKNSDFIAVLNRADIAIPDTVGVVWAGHVLTKNGPERQIPGIEFMEDLTRLAAKHHVPVGLIGGWDNLAVETLNCLQKKYTGLTGWAQDGPEIQIVNDDLRFMNYGNKNSESNNHESPFINHNSKESQYFEMLAKRITKNCVRIVFVALGPPKQEYFIERLAKELPNGVILMAVGGSFDILSGRLPRAPEWMRSIGLEWFWRLILEPRRIFRQLALVEFVWLVLRERLFGRVS